MSVDVKTMLEEHIGLYYNQVQTRKNTASFFISMPDVLIHRTTKKLSPGKYYPLGATLYPDGVNFALYSRHATAVLLLLFDRPDGSPTDCIRLEHRDRYIWHVFVHGIGAGQLYGYKVHGDYDPPRGLRFNPHKLLLDPYAKAVTGKCINSENLLLAYDALSPHKDLVMDERDNTQVMPKCIVVDPAFDWQGDTRPDIPLDRLIIYETHLKGFTAHPSSGVREPGTYRGFIEKIPYLQHLGINAVEFLPLHEFFVEDYHRVRGLTNYWGYNTIGYFAPEFSYCSKTFPGCQVQEFKTLVRELHRVGIEVIMDVVYNHTGEGNELGPTLCFRGIDNLTYYCLDGTPEEPLRKYRDITGCGNSMNLAEPAVMRLVMDSLRYWVQEMHVDGFRFDLATALGREQGRFDKSASFFDAISQDPLLATIKIIAEPWDIETYQLGNFPVDWSEWNGKFRDTVRRFYRGDPGQVQDLGWRLTGSADLYAADGRHPSNSINFVTCHDGFTLYDLVSYNTKHNEANGEDNRDGRDENFSWNCGVEGDTNDPAILSLRRQMAKNFLCCLLFSRGTPMLLGGDEFLRTQRGNNNAYCQDNEISWYDWNMCRTNADMVAFCRRAIALRKRFAVLQGRHFFKGTASCGAELPDILWYNEKLGQPDWHHPETKTICFQIAGTTEHAAEGCNVLFFILHAGCDQIQVLLPAQEGIRWRRIIDTALPAGEDFIDPPGTELTLQHTYTAAPRSFVLLLGS
ncbi:MAG: glycogen debranching protein GlgX [Desulfobacterota bacterium]|nr:glycogen debranching protein GlgX [Thermodesulfobacteriota bacterium]